MRVWEGAVVLWLGGYPAEPSTRLRRDGYPDQWLTTSPQWRPTPSPMYLCSLLPQVEVINVQHIKEHKKESILKVDRLWWTRGS